jgi:hypothetical protein
MVPGERAPHVDAQDTDGRDGSDADAGGDPTETGERDIPALHRGPPALGRARLANSCHCCTVWADPDAHMKKWQFRLRIR